MLPPASSLTNRLSLPPHSIHAGEVGRPWLRSRGCAAIGRNDPHIAACRPLVAHQAADKRDRLSIGRPARHRDLQSVQRTRHLGRRQNRLWRSVQRLRIQLRHPPVVLSRRIGGNISQPLRIRRPVELVHMQIARRRLRDRRSRISVRPAPLPPAESPRPSSPITPGGRLHRRQRSRRPRRSLHIKKSDL